MASAPTQAYKLKDAEDAGPLEWTLDRLAWHGHGRIRQCTLAEMVDGKVYLVFHAARH